MVESSEGFSLIEIQAEHHDPRLSKLTCENGGHRIQRVPPTERKGRVHTSTVTVAVMDDVKTDVPEFNTSDFIIEWYSGTGAGGQHRNKHQNSCRITHIPSGLVATAQCRSRENSLTEAKNTILARLLNMSNARQHSNQSLIRKEKIGSGQRGDKTRTYRFQDDSVKDHKTGKQSTCSKILSGYFDILWN